MLSQTSMSFHSESSSYSQSRTSSHSHSQASLTIEVSSASELAKVQSVGKQDPFVQFSLNFEDKNSFLKTFTQKNAGSNASWDQSFNITLNGEPDLFIEVLDEENTVDEVIGFAAIPINQIVHADGAYLNGLFEIYNTKSERAGLVHLKLAANGFPNSRNPDFSGQPVLGQSYVNEGHCARMKSNKKKATGVAVGGALLGGALAIGAGFLGKKLYDDQKEQQEQEAEQQRLQEEEEEKRKHEREEFDQERARYQQEREEFEREKANRPSHNNNNNNEEREKNDCGRDNEKKHHKRRDSDCSDDGDAKKWNPVGTYAAGDRVKYHGQVYMCLQGHTSNPTWQPGAAHSLWQAE